MTAASLVQSAGTGTTLFTGPVNTNTATGVNLTTNNITQNGVITTTSNGVVMFTNAGLLTVNANINADGAVTQNGAGATTVTGTRTITTTADDVKFATGVTLNGGQLNINTAGTGAATGDITFQGTLTGTSAGAENLNLTAGASSIVFTGAVGGTRLGAVTINSAKDVTETTSLTASSLVQSAGTGLTTLTGLVDTNTATGVNLTTNNITVGAGGITTATNGVVTFTNAGTLNLNGNIGADGAVTQNGAGAVAFGGAGTRTITTTADDVNFLRAVTLSRPVTIATAGTGAGTGDVTFQSTVDSATGQTLGVTAAGSSVLFTGAVGGTNRLGAVTITSAKDVTESAGLKAASLVQSAGTGLTLLTGAVDTNTAAGVSLTTAGAITVNNTITTTTGASGGGVAFSNGGLLTINGDITSDGNVTQAGGGNVTITAPRTITTTGDLVSFANNVTLNGGAAGLVSINTTSGSATGNNITFSGTLTATTAAANEE